MRSSGIQVLNNRSQRSSELLRQIVYRDLLNKQKQNYSRFRAYKQGKIMQLSKGLKIDQKLDKMNLEKLVEKCQINNDEYNKQILTEFQQKQKRMYGQPDNFFNILLEEQNKQREQQYAFHKKDDRLGEREMYFMMNGNKKDSLNQSITNLRETYNCKQSPVQHQSSSDDQDMYMQTDINKKDINKSQKQRRIAPKANYQNQNTLLKEDQQRFYNSTGQQLQSKFGADKNIQDEAKQQQQIEHVQDLQQNTGSQSQQQDMEMSDNDVGGLESKNAQKQKKQNSKSKQEHKNKKSIAVRNNKDRKKINKQQAQSVSIKSSLTENKNVVSSQDKTNIQGNKKQGISPIQKKPHQADLYLDDGQINGGQ